MISEETKAMLKASPAVVDSCATIRAESDRIWEAAWRITWDAVLSGINPDEFIPLLNSNPVLCSLFTEMQHTVYVWKQAGLDVNQIPPAYSVKRAKLENLFIEVEKP